jgi:hypothetical protein
MACVIHSLLLVAAAVSPSDSPPAGTAAAAVAHEEPTSDRQPPCVPPSDTQTAPPQASQSPCPAGGDEPLPPGAPDEDTADVHWMQASHDLVERGINALVLKLDRFFGEPALGPYEPPTSYIRLRNEVRSGEDDSLQAGTSVAGHLRLPTADRMLARLSLIFAGETEPKPLPGPEVDLVPPRFHARVRSASGGLELRVDLARARRTLVDVGAGVRFGMPPPPYTRVRLAQGFPLGIRVVGHLSQSVFWDRTEGFGVTSRLDVDRAFGTRTLARWWSTGTVDEVSRGYEWASEVGVQRVLGARTGLFTAAAIAGATRSAAHVDRYHVYTRLRHDVYGGWAFVEVEPEISWPADAVTSRRARIVAATVRLELQFSSDGRKPTPLTPLPEAAPAPAAGPPT